MVPCSAGEPAAQKGDSIPRSSLFLRPEAVKTLGRIAGKVSELLDVKDPVFGLGVYHQHPGGTAQMLGPQSTNAPVGQLLSAVGLVGTSHIIESESQVDMGQTSQMLLAGKALDVPSLFEFTVEFILHLGPLSVELYDAQGVLHG